MRKDEYLQILSDRLSVLPADEHRDIMEYYKEYFEEAGEDNEEDVIRELGNVEELAANILKENGRLYNKENELYNKVSQPYTTQNGTYTQANIPYGQQEQTYNYINGQQYMPYETQNTGLSTGWKVAIAILTFPIWFGIVTAIFGVIFGFGAGAFTCFFAGISVIIAGFATIGAGTGTFMLFVGAGFIVIAVSLLLLMGCVGLCQLVSKLVKLIFGQKKEPIFM